MGTKEQQCKHWASKDLKIIQSYWVSPPATKRSMYFADYLKQYEFASITEVGMFSGRNLRYIQAAFPKAIIRGVDINAEAVNFAKKKLPGIDFTCMDLHDFDKFPHTSDIVFSSGVLIHVPQEHIESAVSKMLSKAEKYVMHIEQLGNELCAGPKHLKPAYKISDQLQWNVDLVSVYNKLGHDAEVIELPKDIQTNGAKQLVIVKV